MMKIINHTPGLFIKRPGNSPPGAFPGADTKIGTSITANKC